MIDKDTIKALMQGPAIEEARASTAQAVGEHGSGLVALPENFHIHDLEAKLPMRRRARGLMTTPSIEHFGAYVTGHAEEGATVFVDKVKATAILNLGTPASPGQADNKATLCLCPTAAYNALQTLLHESGQRGLPQRVLAEFMEDWAGQIECSTGAGESVQPSRAIDAVRRITIESARKVESDEQSLSAERSVMESVAASSKSAPLPAFIDFTCSPYNGLWHRAFRLRLSIRTGDAVKPALSLAVHLIREEEHMEAMALEVADKVKTALEDHAPAIPVYLGEYSSAR